MKNIILMLSFTFSLVLNSIAQQLEGHVSYTLVMSSDNAETASFLSMMGQSTMDIYFMKDKTRSEVQMGTMMNSTAIVNNKSGEILTLMTGMNGKEAVKSTLEKTNTASDTSKTTVTITDETKVMLGMTCKKAIISDMEDVEVIYWYTTEIDAKVQGQSYVNSKINGFPMEIEMTNNGIKLTITAIKNEPKITKKLKKSLFNMAIPEGYEEVDATELMDGM